MDERLRFVARLLENERMAVLCREFDISRKTGYKLYRRYRDIGLEGLTDRSRRPYLLAGVDDTPRPAPNGDHAKMREAHDSHREMSLEPWFSLRRLLGQNPGQTLMPVHTTLSN